MRPPLRLISRGIWEVKEVAQPASCKPASTCYHRRRDSEGEDETADAPGDTASQVAAQSVNRSYTGDGASGRSVSTLTPQNVRRIPGTRRF